ncbi:KamA family radical SAM protein [candidate division GN15 bacterium]|nr:KamA family radical SAM protein [candidate division GN15 bacterium]
MANAQFVPRFVPRYVRSIDALAALSKDEKKSLKEVCNFHAFRSNDYYLGLINWSDPNDPIRRIAVPQPGELHPFGHIDASKEATNYVAPGVQHKYPHTALVLCTQTCATHCRFCFRKRLFQDDNDETGVNLSEAIAYIKRTPRITNVLLTGGDPLTLSTRRIRSLLKQLRRIPHVGIIRIGTKMPAFNPYRILNDRELLDTISIYSQLEKRIYVIAHFNHPREITPVAAEAIDRLMRAGAILANQTPLLRGVNDKPDVLAELMRKLSYMGVPPYYVFQCRPTKGNYPFELTITEAYRIFERAKKKVSGLAKRPRLVMSHASGKIEIVGVTHKHIYLRYHRARQHEDEGRFMIFHRDDTAYWFDDLVPAEKAPHHLRMLDHMQPQVFGPE